MEAKIPTKEQAEQLAEAFNLKLVLLFGSQTERHTHDESDLDIAVLPAGEFTPQDEIMLNTKLSGLNMDQVHVDTVNLKKAPPLLLKQIIDNCRVLYQEDQTVFSEMEAQAMKRYQDAKPLFELLDERVRRSTSAT